MKAAAPNRADEYFRLTEHAVRHLYGGLDSCWSCYKEALTHWDISQVGQPMTAERKDALCRYLELAGHHLDLKFSEATFAGSILQVAYMGIRLFSQSHTVPVSCAGLMNSLKKHEQESDIPFCIDRERHGLPSGLIVYPARNQYNHLDRQDLHKLNKAVFNALSLAFEDNMMFDLAFNLFNPTIAVYANEILLVALGWKTYDIYLTEMRSMLLPGHG